MAEVISRERADINIEQRIDRARYSLSAPEQQQFDQHIQDNPRRIFDLKELYHMKSSGNMLDVIDRSIQIRPDLRKGYDQMNARVAEQLALVSIDPLSQHEEITSSLNDPIFAKNVKVHNLVFNAFLTSTNSEENATKVYPIV